MVDFLLVFARFDPGDLVAAGDSVAHIEIDRFQPSADFRRDFDLRPRLQRAGEDAAVFDGGPDGQGRINGDRVGGTPLFFLLFLKMFLNPEIHPDGESRQQRWNEDPGQYLLPHSRRLSF
ncbi:hypothetical protein SDC9_139200 [bioreactor metagenome]|uniref:Uncharacterized protein n=1 Tax=bioreactor metagenome TaxID=1076179 RepID=A0A645DRW4_9ZZZZ